MMRRSLFTALAAAAITTPALIAPALVTPAAAQVDFNVVIGSPPPPPRYEVVPAPRSGYVWAPGHWVAERRGYHWVPDRWAQTNGGWRHQPGYWDRQQARAMGDRDHDGVPNAYDRSPDNPYRR